MINIYGYNNHWISRLIRWKLKFKYSHIGILDEENQTVIESIGPPIREYLAHELFNKPYSRRYGVVETPIKEFKARYVETATRYIEGDIRKAWARIGMPFDMVGLICAGLGINYHNPLKDFCVETISHAVTHIENHEAHLQTTKTIWYMSEPTHDEEGPHK